jgi:twinkle protein
MTADYTPRTGASRSPSTETEPSGSATTAASRAERHGPPITSHLVALIEQRGIDAEQLTLRRGVTASEMLGGDGIAIPYHDNGEQVGRKHRTLTTPKRFLQDKGSAQIFYNVDVLRDDTLADLPLVITEGEIDCWSAIDAGLSRAVSVPGGAPSEPVDEMNATKYGFVRHAQDLGLLSQERVRNIVLAVDGDANGVNLQHDLLLRLGAARCRIVEYPAGCKDLNDVLRMLGSDAVRACIYNAEPAPISGWWDYDEWPFPTDYPALTTGIDGMDDHYKPRLGDMVLVTGIPGMGKSSLVNEVIGRMAMRPHNWRWVVAPFETTKGEFTREFRTFHRGMLQRSTYSKVRPSRSPEAADHPRRRWQGRC